VLRKNEFYELELSSSRGQMATLAVCEIVLHDRLERPDSGERVLGSLAV